RHREEVRAVLPVDVLDVDQADVRLVHQRCGLKRVAHLLTGHITFSDLMEFAFDERYKARERRFITAAPRQQQARYVERTFSNRRFLPPRIAPFHFSTTFPASMPEGENALSHAIRVAIAGLVLLTCAERTSAREAAAMTRVRSESRNLIAAIAYGTEESP